MTQSDREAKLLAQARSELGCWSRGDTEGYGKSAAPDITYFHNAPAGARIDGVDAFRELLGELEGVIPPHDQEIIDPKVQIHGDVGILTLVYRALLPDGEILAQGRGTTVYRETNGDWEMVHCHWSAFDESMESAI